MHECRVNQGNEDVQHEKGGAHAWSDAKECYMINISYRSITSQFRHGAGDRSVLTHKAEYKKKE